MVSSEILKFLFSEQAIYTKNLIGSCLADLPDAMHIQAKLARNHEEIIKILGYNHKTFNSLINERINSIVGVVLGAKSGIPSHFDKSVRELFKTSDELVKKLNLPQEELKQVLKAQNQYIIDITLARLGGEYLNEIKIFDEFHIEMVNIVDMFNRVDCNCYILLYLFLLVIVVVLIFYLFIRCYYSNYILFNSSMSHPASLK